MAEKTVHTAFGEMHYKVIGSGFPVVLLHGFGEDGSVWDGQLQALEQNFKLIIPDLPGSGRSAELSVTGAGLEDFADSIHQVVLSEKIDQFCLIGHSMGGYITLAYAEKYQSTLAGICLFHSSAYADDEEKIFTRKKGIAFIGEHGSEAFLNTSVPTLFAEPLKHETEINTLIEKGSLINSNTLINYNEAMLTRPDRTNILRNLSIPAAFVLGVYDKAVAFEPGLRQTHLPSTAFVYILRNSGHMGMIEEQEHANAHLLNFLSFMKYQLARDHKRLKVNL